MPAPAPLADQIRDTCGLYFGGIAGHLRSHQTHRSTARLGRHRRQIREADAMIPVEAMPPLMFGGLVLFMLVGYPVAFSLAALGFFFGCIAIEYGFFGLNYLQAIPGHVFGNVLSNDLLLAIPFFTLMGAVLEQCGLAEDMLDSMGQLFGPIRGGLGYSVNHRWLHSWRHYRYRCRASYRDGVDLDADNDPLRLQHALHDRRLGRFGNHHATGPPSLVLIVLADQLGKSVGDMYPARGARRFSRLRSSRSILLRSPS